MSVLRWKVTGRPRDFKGMWADPVEVVMACHYDDAVAALREFVDHYPHGLNPYLDAACNKARDILRDADTTCEAPKHDADCNIAYGRCDCRLRDTTGAEHGKP